MELIVKELLDKVNANIGIAVTKSRMVLEPYRQVYPSNLVEATDKMLDEIYNTRVTITDTRALDDAIDMYLKTTRPYKEEEAKATINEILEEAVGAVIDPIFDKYSAEAPKLVCSSKIYENFCDYVLDEIAYNLESTRNTTKIVDKIMSSWRYHEIEDFEL